MKLKAENFKSGNGTSYCKANIKSGNGVYLYKIHR